MRPTQASSKHKNSTFLIHLPILIILTLMQYDTLCYACLLLQTYVRTYINMNRFKENQQKKKPTKSTPFRSTTAWFFWKFKNYKLVKKEKLRRNPQKPWFLIFNDTRPVPDENKIGCLKKKNTFLFKQNAFLSFVYKSYRTNRMVTAIFVAVQCYQCHPALTHTVQKRKYVNHLNTRAVRKIFNQKSE